MDCPERYNNKQFMQNIINPAVKSLQDYFKELNCEPKYARKRGKPVIRYIFTFIPENRAIEADQSQNKMKKSDQNQQPKQNSFANFHQREYDYDSLEKELLNGQNNS